MESTQASTAHLFKDDNQRERERERERESKNIELWREMGKLF